MPGRGMEATWEISIHGIGWRITVRWPLVAESRRKPFSSSKARQPERFTKSINRSIARPIRQWSEEGGTSRTRQKASSKADGWRRPMTGPVHVDQEISTD